MKGGFAWLDVIHQLRIAQKGKLKMTYELDHVVIYLSWYLQWYFCILNQSFDCGSSSEIPVQMS